jgi:hypothetical protein
MTTILKRGMALLASGEVFISSFFFDMVVTELFDGDVVVASQTEEQFSEGFQ